MLRAKSDLRDRRSKRWSSSRTRGGLPNTGTATIDSTTTTTTTSNPSSTPTYSGKGISITGGYSKMVDQYAGRLIHQLKMFWSTSLRPMLEKTNRKTLIIRTVIVCAILTDITIKKACYDALKNIGGGGGAGTGNGGNRRLGIWQRRQKVDVVLLSNRILPSAVTLSSLCRATEIHQRDMTFHIITERVLDFRIYFDHLPDCHGANLNLLSVTQATFALQDLGFKPVWVEGSYSEDMDAADWGVRTPYTDERHSHALNLLRFYLPYLPTLATSDKIVYLDDDVIVQGDISNLLNLEFDDGKAMLAGCQHWTWKASENTLGSFELSNHLTITDTGYIGNMFKTCKDEFDDGCTRDGLERDIALASLRLDADSPLADRPLERRAFNMGMNLLDVRTWKKLRLTHLYEKWVDTSMKEHFFPTDTLAFGLGLAYLALGDTVDCYDEHITHIVGLGFASEVAFARHGWSIDRMKEEAFALHFNGKTKPWTEHMEICGSNNKPHSPETLVEMWQEACVNATLCSCHDGPSILAEAYDGHDRPMPKKERKRRWGLGKKKKDEAQPEPATDATSETAATTAEKTAEQAEVIKEAAAREEQQKRANDLITKIDEEMEDTPPKDETSGTQVEVTEGSGTDGAVATTGSATSKTICTKNDAGEEQCSLFPTLYVIGCGRCGSTSLYTMMKRHKEVLISQVVGDEPLWRAKELEYWSDSYPDQPWYLSHYPVPSADANNFKVALDATPSYATYAKVPERMVEATPPEIIPQMRFIEILRDPADRFLSYFCQILGGGDWIGWVPHLTEHLGLKLEQESLAPLVTQAVTAINGCLAEHPDPAKDQRTFEHCMHGHNLLFKIISDGLYYRQLQAWISFFKPEQFMLLTTTDMSDRNPDRLLKVSENVVDFAGLSRDKEFFTEVLSHNSQVNRQLNKQCGKKTVPASALAELRAFYESHNQNLLDWVVANKESMSVDDGTIELMREWGKDKKEEPAETAPAAATETTTETTETATAAA